LFAERVKRGVRMMIVDNAIYVNGHRASEPRSLRETYEALRKERGVAWIGLYRPTEEEFASVAEEFELHELAVEDALEAHQRPKLERYGQTLFVVLRPARYLDDPEEVEFGEIHVFVGEDFVITVRHGEAPALGEVRERLEAAPELLVRGPEAILYAIMDRVVDGYAPVVKGLENDIDEIEVEVFSGNPGVSKRTYELSREVIEFQRAVKPLSGMLASLIAGFEKYGVDPELQRYLRDVQDHAIEVTERVAGFKDLLQNILSVNLTLVGLQQNEEVKALSEASIRQNDEVKKISAWAAILFAPTLIGTVYGMNFDHMPELHWVLGYPFALGLMVLVSATLYLVFKNRGWL
jgi:magnesium transporter